MITCGRGIARRCAFPLTRRSCRRGITLPASAPFPAGEHERRSGYQLMSARPRGTATGRPTASSRGAGRDTTASACSSRSNHAVNQSQCYSRLPFPDLNGRSVQFKDLMGAAAYDRDGADMVSRGLDLDLPPWGYHVFKVTAL